LARADGLVRTKNTKAAMLAKGCFASEWTPREPFASFVFLVFE